MSAADVLRFAAAALRGHGLRTVLSMTGVAVGVAAVVLLTGLGEGARVYITDQFMSLGTNVLMVVPGRNETTGGIPGIGGAPRDLTLADAESLTRGIRGVLRVAPAVMGNETVSQGNLSKQVAILGTSPEMQPIRAIRMAAGSFLPTGDWERGGPVAVIGAGLAEELFPGRQAMGSVLRVGDFRMRVIGVAAPRGVTLGVDLDDIVIVPVATGMRIFNRNSLFRITIQHDPRVDIDRLSAEVTRTLAERHDDEIDFTLVTQDAVLEAFGAVFQALTAALAGIAAISLTVAGVGIMNVMLVAVSERTREVGLLKAVGAHPRQILAAFLVEAMLLAAAGGALGMGVALGLVRALAAFYPAFDATPPGWALGAALAVSIGIGALFGVLPARQATRLDPITALRS